MQKVNLKDILYIEGMKDYLKFVVTTGRCIMTLLSFKRVEEMLPADRFCRVHKSYIVSVDKIESVERGLIQIADKRIPIGDNYKKCFQNILESKSLI
jgi:DNA-binding LytR/AlgR family response regulator